MNVKSKAREYPVTLAGVVLGVLMALATKYLGPEQADALFMWFVLIAPIIAGFITQRFTFSKDFVLWLLKITEPNEALMRSKDKRLANRYLRDK